VEEYIYKSTVACRDPLLGSGHKTTSAARQQILKKHIHGAVTEQRLRKQTCSHGNESTRNNRETAGNGVFHATHAEMLQGNWSICVTLCGGGFEYLHRSPVSRRRRREGNPVPPCSWEVQIRVEGASYQGLFRWTRTREGLRWRGPTLILNDRPILS
jgi:hypothetical protein